MLAQRVDLVRQIECARLLGAARLHLPQNFVQLEDFDGESFVLGIIATCG